MTYTVPSGSVLLTHEWVDNWKVPSGFTKRPVDHVLTFPDTSLMHDPQKGTGGWTQLARAKSIAAKLFGDNRPTYGPAWFIEQHYFIFQSNDQLHDSELDFVLIHHRCVHYES